MEQVMRNSFPKSVYINFRQKIISAISVNTHLDSISTPEVPLLPAASGTRPRCLKMNPLPTKYTLVKPVVLHERSIKLPIDDTDKQCAPSENEKSDTSIEKLTELVKAAKCENMWLEVVKNEVAGRNSTKNVSWSAFHANRLKDKIVIKDKSGLLPLFSESAESPDMICHTFELILEATNYLNPGQPAVLECDQPVFAVSKKSQCRT